MKRSRSSTSPLVLVQLTATGEMFYFASVEETPAKMAELVAWYRQEEETLTMHPVALAAEFHYRFVRIHPFDDGNGRMSRLLMNLILLRHGYPMTVIKAADRNRYLAALSEADAGEFRPFLGFIIENVEAGLRLMIRAAQGESIDEPDDLDKKLALLKKQVLSREDAVKLLWDDEVQDDFFDILLSPWLDDFNKQTERFDELFMSQGFVGRIDSVLPHPTFISDNPDIQSFKAAFKAAISGLNAHIDSLLFSKRWYHFRQLNNGFDLGLDIVFLFSLDNFSVNEAVISEYGKHMYSAAHGEEKVFSSIYLPAYDHTRIHEINYRLANKTYDFINAKMDQYHSIFN